MGRRQKDIQPEDDWNLPLRDYWRAINRQEREAQAEKRARRRATDKRRPKCRCEAYPWPHRPGGGFCRHPDPPIERWQRKPGGRPWRKRYAGILRQIARANGLHPIRDHAAIEAVMPQVVAQAKQLKQIYPAVRYRSMTITPNGVTGQVQSAGPMM